MPRRQCHLSSESDKPLTMEAQNDLYIKRKDSCDKCYAVQIMRTLYNRFIILEKVGKKTIYNANFTECRDFCTEDPLCKSDFKITKNLLFFFSL